MRIGFGLEFFLYTKNCKSAVWKPQKKQANIINPALLWKYNLETFNYKKAYKIVIERILQMGNLDEWRKMVRFYSIEQILETIDWIAQLDERDKKFAKFF